MMFPPNSTVVDKTTKVKYLIVSNDSGKILGIASPDSSDSDAMNSTSSIATFSTGPIVELNAAQLTEYSKVIEPI